jgi:hypothetical protein
LLGLAILYLLGIYRDFVRKGCIFLRKVIFLFNRVVFLKVVLILDVELIMGPMQQFFVGIILWVLIVLVIVLVIKLELASEDLIYIVVHLNQA